MGMAWLRRADGRHGAGPVPHWGQGVCGAALAWAWRLPMSCLQPFPGAIQRATHLISEMDQETLSACVCVCACVKCVHGTYLLIFVCHVHSIFFQQQQATPSVGVFSMSVFFFVTSAAAPITTILVSAREGGPGPGAWRCPAGCSPARHPRSCGRSCRGRTSWRSSAGIPPLLASAHWTSGVLNLPLK